MAISGTTTDYSGRQIDISVFQGVNPSGQATITPSFGNVPQYCAGIQKLVQRYTISLLTELGSQTNFPDFGTTLISELQTNISVVDARHAFAFANMSVIQTFKVDQTNTDRPLDEQIDTASLVDLSIINGVVSLTVQITTMSLDVIQFIMPLPITA